VWYVKVHLTRLFLRLNAEEANVAVETVGTSIFPRSLKEIKIAQTGKETMLVKALCTIG